MAEHDTARERTPSDAQTAIRNWLVYGLFRHSDDDLRLALAELDRLTDELGKARAAAAAPIAFPHGWEDAVSDVLEDGVDGPEWPHVRDTLLVLLRGWIARTPTPAAGDPPAWSAPDVDPASWLRGATSAGNPLAPAILAVLDELEKLRARAARTEGLELVHRQAVHLAVEANAVARNLGGMVDRG